MISRSIARNFIFLSKRLPLTLLPQNNAYNKEELGNKAFSVYLLFKDDIKKGNLKSPKRIDG